MKSQSVQYSRMQLANSGNAQTGYQRGWDFPNLLFSSSVVSGLIEPMNLPQIPGGSLLAFLMQLLASMASYPFQKRNCCLKCAISPAREGQRHIYTVHGDIKETFNASLPRHLTGLMPTHFPLLLLGTAKILGLPWSP